MEEVVFRAIAIDGFVVLLNGITAKPFWAILASSVLWSAPHVITKSHAQLVGLFLGSLFLGYIYYKSRSLLLPAWLHVVANVGHAGGIIVAALYCLLSLSDYAIWAARRPAPLLEARSKQNGL